MAKPDPSKVNAKEIVERMRSAGGFKNLTELAKKLDISSTAISNLTERQSVSLPLLIKGAELCGVTLDYLVYGGESDKKAGEMNAYVDIERVGGGVVKILAELLPRSVDMSKLRAYIQNGKLAVVDTGDMVVTNGFFAFGSPDRPAVRKCKLNLDGSVMVEDEEDAKTIDELNKLGIVGRVVA